METITLAGYNGKEHKENLTKIIKEGYVILELYLGPYMHVFGIDSTVVMMCKMLYEKAVDVPQGSILAGLEGYLFIRDQNHTDTHKTLKMAEKDGVFVIPMQT